MRKRFKNNEVSSLSKTNKIYYILIYEGMICILPFLFFLLKLETLSLISFIFIFILLPFLTARIIVMLFCNFFITLIMLFTMLALNFNHLNSDYDALLLLIFIVIFLFISIIQAFFIILKVYKQAPPSKIIVNRKNLLFEMISVFIYFVEKTVYRLGLLLPILYYAFITFILIFTYAVMYNGLNDFYENSQASPGFYTNLDNIVDSEQEGDIGSYIYKNYPQDLKDSERNLRMPSVNIRNDQAETYKSILKFTMSEYFYFSSTTFFTVGYGDVDIRGRIPKMIVQSEMFLANLFNVIFVPLILFSVTDYLSKRSKKTRFNLVKKSSTIIAQDINSLEEKSSFPPRSARKYIKKM